MFSKKQPRYHRRRLVNSLRSAFGFRLNRPRIASPYQSEVEHDEDDSEDFVWDVPNPFAPLDPTQAHLHALIQAEIARMRRYESIGPLQSLPKPHDGWNEFDDDEESDDEDTHGDDTFESDDEDGDSEDADADDEDEDSDDNDDDDSDVNKHNVIVLPRYTPSPLPPPPPPSPSDTASTDDGDPLWHDLAQVYNDLAEAEERARKARRDAHRSRLKALTV